MNYYNPNPYASYPYTGGMPNSPGYMNQIGGSYNAYPQMQTNQPIQQNNSILNGKLVDSKDVVKATEVPIGSYGVFPKADFSEIYVKLWNNDGTTSVVDFKPSLAKEEKVVEESEESKILNSLLGRFNSLEAKLDNIINNAKGATVNDY